MPERTRVAGQFATVVPGRARTRDKVVPVPECVRVGMIGGEPVAAVEGHVSTVAPARARTEDFHGNEVMPRA